MTIQKIPSEQKPSTNVTSVQLALMFLLLGIAAGVFASLLLGVQEKLRGGLWSWYASIVVGLALFIGLALGYLKFKHKAGKLTLPPKP